MYEFDLLTCACAVQVEHIDIGYAKTAKRIDVKKLKTAMWSVVSRQAEVSGVLFD